MRYAHPFGHWELNQLPGCAQVVVSNHAFTKPELRGQGKGQTMHLTRLTQMADMGFDYALCTVVSTNKAEKHILAKNGWKKLDEFRNSETTNLVEIWGRLVGEQTYTHIA